MLKNAPTLAIGGVDTAENGTSNVRQVTNKICRNIGLQWAGIPLNQWFSVRPRSFGGLLGIPFSHFLHGNWDHLKGSLAGWYLMGTQILLDGSLAFLCTFAFVGGVGAGLQWVVGRGDH